MLKAVSSITNAVGALNYKGTWNANTNSPALASGVGTKGDYYVVSVAGTTTLDGISNWGIGDWAVFNGSVWQRVEGGADLNGVNLSVSGTSTLDGNVTFKDNLTQGTAGKGVNFTANTPAAGMTSQLLNWYEEGTWTPTYVSTNGDMNVSVYDVQEASYTRVGRLVTAFFKIATNTVAAAGTGFVRIAGLPFTSKSTGPWGVAAVAYSSNGKLKYGYVNNSSTFIEVTGEQTSDAQSSVYPVATSNFGPTAGYGNYMIGVVTYTV